MLYHKLSYGWSINRSCRFTFLTQQVKEPTRKLNILDLIFCPDDLVNYITTTDTFLSDHRIINVSTSIPVPQTIPVAQSLNPSSNVFEKIDFNRADWPQLAKSLNNIDWEHELYQLSTEMYLPFATKYYCRKMYVTYSKKKWQKEKNFNVSSEENNPHEKRDVNLLNHTNLTVIKMLKYCI